MATDDEKAEKARRDAEREAAWKKAQADIERHDREFEEKHGKGGQG